jgi:hypothetical protein
MTNVYLLSTDADTALQFCGSLTFIGAVAVHSGAWLIPWTHSFGSLLARIRSILPEDHAKVVITEISGDYFLM